MMASRDTERGATLLSVLAIVMLMSVAAVAATDALARSVALAKSSGARAETFWTARGAAEAAAAYLDRAYEATGGRFNDETELFTQPVILPAGHGVVSFQVREASNCFNLNAMLEDATVGDNQLSAYASLLVAAGINEAEARSLSEKLADWIDSDSTSRTYGAERGYYASLAEPYRPADRRLRSLSELRTIAGYDPDVLEKIGGLVCLRPGIAQPALNINTLTEANAVLLTGLFSEELSDSDARELIAARPPRGWPDVETFLLEPAVARIAPMARRDGALSVASDWLEADIDIGTGDLATSYRALYGRDGNGKLSLGSMVRRDF